ncbi:MAG TPA: fatty acid desaturase family protein [Chitinophagales bacterium]|nr:fatty acid desaturase family protein [Chitinophagales bacterium]
MYQGLTNTETIRQYSKRNSLKVLSVIFLEWFIVISTVYLAIYFNRFLIYPFAVLIIATRMYALYSLAHEACHFNLFKNKKTNDWVGNIFIAWPIFIDIQDMRKIHFSHHKYLQTKDDPEIKHLEYDEFQFPLSRKKLLLILFKDLLGYNFIKYRWNYTKWRFVFKNLKIYQVIFYSIVLLGFAWSSHFFTCILLWIVPYMTIYQLLNRVRLYSEHFNLPDQLEYKTRTLHLPMWSAFFIAPYGLGYHAEHHFYPSVPFYNLKKLHKEISNKEKYVKEVLLEKKYWWMFQK